MWCNVGFAEKISDFELDGISIGDSLLKYMSEEEIISQQKKAMKHTKIWASKFFLKFIWNLLTIA